MSGRSGRTIRANGGKPSSLKPFPAFLHIFILPLVSAALFSASFPSFLSLSGWGSLGYIALLPFFYALLRLPTRIAPLASLVFTSVSYSAMNPWLYSYHPAAPVLVLAAMGIWGALASLAMAFFLKRYSKFGFLAAACVWVAVEYSRNCGFSAFPYGMLGASQYLNPSLLQSASVWGVWGPSFVLCALSAFLAQFLFSLRSRHDKHSFTAWIRPGLFIFLMLTASHSIGWFFPTGQANTGKRLSVLAIQPDNEPRREAVLPASWYAERIEGLIREGLASHPGIDVVITPETAFPPSIELRMASQGDSEDDRAVRSFMRSLSGYGTPIILGNDHGKFGTTPSGERDRLHYNAALLIESGEIRALYSKNRLVPYIEHFPFYRAFPGVYRFVERENGMVWTPGTRMGVFCVNGVGIGTPICFEDCFGDICRDFSRMGADILVPMASDAWSRSEIAMRQHLASAVFRAVETRRPVLRVSNDGITCSISPMGKIDSVLPAFSRGSAVFSLETATAARTPYYLWGDWLPVLCALCAAILAAASFHARSGLRAASDSGKVLH